MIKHIWGIIGLTFLCFCTNVQSDNWNWKKTWGWDFLRVDMTAVRLDRPDKAIDALFMKVQTNTYLPNTIIRINA